jgi:hypothetical protein
MVEHEATQKSLAEQIIQETLARLAGHEEFDAETLRRLEQLGTGNNLNKPRKVAEAIRSVQGVQE